MGVINSPFEKGVRGIDMRIIIRIAFIVLVATSLSFVQGAKPAFSFGGKTGDCTMTWEEFYACKKELTPLDKNTSVSSFVLTVKRVVKKDFLFDEYPSKTNQFGKGAMTAIEQLHTDKKLGDKLLISGVQLVQSGKSAKEVPEMVITLILN